MQRADGRRRQRGAWAAALLGGLLIGPGLAAGQTQPDARDRIDEALDQLVPQISIEKLPIREALAALQQKLNVRFEIADATADLLPYGARTRITITLQSISARNGLTRIFDGLGLAMRVGDAAVHLEPGPVLRRLGRRMSIAEVELLARLAERPWSELRTAGGPAVQFEIPPAAKPAEALEQALAQVPGASALRQLEAATAALGWVWLPREDALAFLTRRDFVNALLDRPLACNYRQAPLDDTIQDIGRRSGVHIAFEPGVLDTVDASARAVSLVSPRGSARQMLELISGGTGLRYEVGEEGVRIYADPDRTPGGPLGTALATAPAGSSAGPRVVVILHKPVGPNGLAVDFLIREDELPPELQQMRREVLDEVIAELRRIIAAREAAPRP